MRLLAAFALSLSAAAILYGQAGTGTITGTVTDQSGAVVANAAIEAKSAETGVVYPTQSTSTGNYTLTQFPVGSYEISVKVTGFKTYTHTRLQVQAAQILREDVQLQVGGTGEQVTVTAEASLLKTESGDLAHNITADSLGTFPFWGSAAPTRGARASGIPTTWPP
jgi:hypothetical protein